MDQTLFCVLGFFLLNLIPHGLAQGNRPRVTITPNWPEIFWGETITLRCEIEGGGGNEWTFGWTTPGTSKHPNNEYIISHADDREYRCLGRRGSPDPAETPWSDPFKLNVTTDRPWAELRADRTSIPAGGAVTLICGVNPSSSGWKYLWYREDKSTNTLVTQDDGNHSNGQISVSQGGVYRCRGARGDPDYYTHYSDSVSVNRTLSNRAVVTLQAQWTEIYSGEKITLRCKIEGGEESKWEYEWETTSSKRFVRQSESFQISATYNSEGEYKCKGKHKTEELTSTEWSTPITLIVSAQTPKAELRADRGSIPAGGAVTLTCNVNPSSSGWKYLWYREDKSTNTLGTQDYVYHSNGQISVSQGGVYRCRGARGDPVYYTEDSDSVSINRTLSNRAVVTLQPQWTEIYSGEKITFRCKIEGGEESKWEYEWETTSSKRIVGQSESFQISATSYSEGEYKCKGKHRTEELTSTEWSTPFTLKVSAQTPKAELKADDTNIPVGGDVTLTCSVSLSSGWEYYFWYRADKSSNPSTIKDIPSTGQIRVSKEGLYRCRVGRGNPAYYTEDSDSVQLKEYTVANKAVVTLHPNWSEIYNEESITLRCEIKDGDDTEWEYEWETTSSVKPPKEKEYRIGPAYTSHSGNYSCKGKKKSDKSPTGWSDPITLTVLYWLPQPVLTVSPLWLSAGDWVTLNCDVTHSSAGWRFYWYKATPKLSDDPYNYQLLSESEKYSFIVHGQTHTAGYVCRAGRGDPERYTPYSEPKFVWSGDLSSSASLTVSPERVQHFISYSVSLKCEGNSTQWRVRFQKDSYLTDCSQGGKMTGSTCTITRYISRNHVCWCESGSGEFSNAVNITKQRDYIILVSPVHPVTEGSSVIISCTLRYKDPVSNVFFYRNNKLIQNDTRKQLNISAVSKSDEGFYKCKTSGRESSQSWMSVTAVSTSEISPFPVIPVIVGLICGIVLIILLLLLYRCKRSKDSSLIRSVQPEGTNQDSATNPAAQHHLYSSPLQDANQSQPQDVTYSRLELKNMGKKGKKPEPNDSTIYSDVKLETEDQSVLYSHVSCHNPGKAKKKKGKPNPAVTEESVYSELKPDQ